MGDLKAYNRRNVGKTSRHKLAPGFECAIPDVQGNFECGHIFTLKMCTDFRKGQCGAVWVRGRSTHLVLSTEMALSRRSCHRAWRKATAARWSSGGHQYFPCCRESMRSSTTCRQLHSPSRNSCTQAVS